jgi:uncharacterized protein with von Willebrand factor type A (vWA) domain
MQPRIIPLAGKLKAILRHNAMEAPRLGQRRGRFDPSRAYRLPAGSANVFRRSGTFGGHDYNFALLVDTSGSMWSYEIRRAFEATVLIAEAFEQARLGCMIILWDAVMRHVRPIREPLGEHRGAIGAIMGATGGGGDTIDSPAIARAQDELKQLGGQRMLIEITDGGSATKRESEQLIKELVSDGILAVTIRIGGQPASYFPHRYQVQHADELVQLLPRIINEVVRRGSC